MQGLDYATTKVLLIGASEFHDDPQIVDIPNVAVNIEKLYALLQDTEIMGIPEANITKSLNESKLTVEKKLNRVVKETNSREHTLIVYYSGHGMYSKHNYRLYLTTSQTTEEDLEASAIKGDTFKEYIGRSSAGRKIVILDCCHSGKLLNSMGSKVNNVEVLISTFEGTYVMASSASDVPSLFPKDEKERPTYFTEKLLETINGGLDNKSELCSLDDIFSNIEQALVQDGRPRPQQSVYKSVGEIGLSKNKKFVPALPDYEVAWQAALEKNNKWVYDDYIKEFEDSPYMDEAISKLAQIEDEEKWQLAKKANTMAALRNYLYTQKNGRYRDEANQLLKELWEKKNVNEIIIEEDIEKGKLAFQILLDEANTFFYNEKNYKLAQSKYEEAFEMNPSEWIKDKINECINKQQENNPSIEDVTIKEIILTRDSIPEKGKEVPEKNSERGYEISEESDGNGINIKTHKKHDFIKLTFLWTLVIGCIVFVSICTQRKKPTERNNIVQLPNEEGSFLYAQSLLDNKHYKAGLGILFKLAYNDVVVAQNKLGSMYTDNNDSDGTKRNYYSALVWYRKSAEQGDAVGQYNLGRIYDSVKSMTDSALKWYRKSAEQGYVEGQFNLGRMYEKRWEIGSVFTRRIEYDSAKKWYLKAAGQGHEQASKMLANIEVKEAKDKENIW